MTNKEYSDKVRKIEKTLFQALVELTELDTDTPPEDLHMLNRATYEMQNAQNAVRTILLWGNRRDTEKNSSELRTKNTTLDSDQELHVSE